MAKWTTADIPDQTGRVAVITGANTGLGYETAQALAGKRCPRGVSRPQSRQGQGRRRPHPQEQSQRGRGAAGTRLDVAGLDPRRRGATPRHHDHIDLLINNAGVMYTPKSHTKDGFEMQFGTNHLGHFAFTGLLLDRLLPVAGSRVVTISSMGHRIRADIHFDDLQWEHSYNRVSAYGQAKLANLLFTYELQRRLAPHGTTIAVAAHPGGSNTELMRHLPGWAASVYPVIAPIFQDAAMGALPQLRAATDPAVLGGQYYGPDGLGQTRGYPKVVGSSKKSHDAERQRRLWAVSQELTGVTYPVLGQIEQLLVEATEAAGRVDQMDLQNPMADAGPGVGAPHRLGRPRHDVPLGVVSGDLLVRELPEQMPGDRAAEFEAFRLGERDDVVV